MITTCMTCPILVASPAPITAPAQPAASAEKLLRALGYTTQEGEGLRRGEIVSHAVKERSGKEVRKHFEDVLASLGEPGK